MRSHRFDPALAGWNGGSHIRGGSHGKPCVPATSIAGGMRLQKEPDREGSFGGSRNVSKSSRQRRGGEERSLPGCESSVLIGSCSAWSWFPGLLESEGPLMNGWLHFRVPMDRQVLLLGPNLAGFQPFYFPLNPEMPGRLSGHGRFLLSGIGPESPQKIPGPPTAQKGESIGTIDEKKSKS